MEHLFTISEKEYKELKKEYAELEKEKSERKIKNLDIIHLIEIINGINQDYKEQLDKMGDKLKAIVRMRVV